MTDLCGQVLCQCRINQVIIHGNQNGTDRFGKVRSGRYRHGVTMPVIGYQVDQVQVGQQF